MSAKSKLQSAEETTSTERESVYSAPKKKDIDSFFTRVGALKRLASEHATKASEVVADFVTNKGFHRGASMLALKVDKMDAVKRSEFLFQFDMLRKARKWDTRDMFPDRGAAEEEETSDEQRDLRPRNLRTGSSVPAGPVVKAVEDAERRAAETASKEKGADMTPGAAKH